MKINLSGKVILVTGASRGIGKAIAESLGNAGATVAVHYNKNRKSAMEVTDKIRNQSKAFQADLRKTDACINLFEKVVGFYGKLHVLVNNAGIFFSSELESENWIEEWNLTLDTNLRSAALLSRLAILQFTKENGGRIINISSRAAFRGDNPEHLAYAASKAGMVALTKSIARGFGKKNITSFLVAPGWVNTDMNKETIKIHGENSITDDLALETLTEPADIAPMITLLASGLADHATGTTIDINAGSYVH